MVIAVIVCWKRICRNTKGIGVNVSGNKYICIPESNIIKIPNDIEDKIAALFDPLGNAFHTALSFGVVGEDVLINGFTNWDYGSKNLSINWFQKSNFK